MTTSTSRPASAASQASRCPGRKSGKPKRLCNELARSTAVQAAPGGSSSRDFGPVLLRKVRGLRAAPLRRVGQWRQDLLELLAHVLVVGRQGERLAERLERFVGREPRA